jgi:hypothetical protein
MVRRGRKLPVACPEQGDVVGRRRTVEGAGGGWLFLAWAGPT